MDSRAAGVSSSPSSSRRRRADPAVDPAAAAAVAAAVAAAAAAAAVDIGAAQARGVAPGVAPGVSLALAVDHGSGGRLVPAGAGAGARRAVVLAGASVAGVLTVNVPPQQQQHQRQHQQRPAQQEGARKGAGGPRKGAAAAEADTACRVSAVFVAVLAERLHETKAGAGVHERVRVYVRKYLLWPPPLDILPARAAPSAAPVLPAGPHRFPFRVPMPRESDVAGGLGGPGAPGGRASGTPARKDKASSRKKKDRVRPPAAPQPVVVRVVGIAQIAQEQQQQQHGGAPSQSVFEISELGVLCPAPAPHPTQPTQPQPQPQPQPRGRARVRAPAPPVTVSTPPADSITPGGDKRAGDRGARRTPRGASLSPRRSSPSPSPSPSALSSPSSPSAPATQQHPPAAAAAGLRLLLPPPLAAGHHRSRSYDLSSSPAGRGPTGSRGDAGGPRRSAHAASPPFVSVRGAAVDLAVPTVPRNLTSHASSDLPKPLAGTPLAPPPLVPTRPSDSPHHHPPPLLVVPPAPASSSASPSSTRFFDEGSNYQNLPEFLDAGDSDAFPSDDDVSREEKDAGALRPLPKGWVTRIDGTGRIYFANTATGLRTFEDPRGSAPAAAEAGAGAGSAGCAAAPVVVSRSAYGKVPDIAPPRSEDVAGAPSDEDRGQNTYGDITMAAAAAATTSTAAPHSGEEYANIPSTIPISAQATNLRGLRDALAYGTIIPADVSTAAIMKDGSLEDRGLF